MPELTPAQLASSLEYLDDMGCGATAEALRDHIDTIAAKLAQAEARCEELREAANWVMHLHSGVSKSGESGCISDDEWKACLDALMLALNPTPDEPVACPFCRAPYYVEVVGDIANCSTCKAEWTMETQPAPSTAECATTPTTEGKELIEAVDKYIAAVELQRNWLAVEDIDPALKALRELRDRFTLADAGEGQTT